MDKTTTRPWDPAEHLACLESATLIHQSPQPLPSTFTTLATPAPPRSQPALLALGW